MCIYPFTVMVNVMYSNDRGFKIASKGYKCYTNIKKICNRKRREVLTYLEI